MGSMDSPLRVGLCSVGKSQPQKVIILGTDAWSQPAYQVRLFIGAEVLGKIIEDPIDLSSEEKQELKVLLRNQHCIKFCCCGCVLPAVVYGLVFVGAA